MISFINFEDTYAMPDIFCKFNNVDFLDKTEKLAEVLPNVIISTGLSSPKVLSVDNNLMSIVKQLNAKEIYFVFDVDSEKCIANSIMSYDFLKQRIDFMKDKLNKFGLGDVNLYFMPVIFCAETLVLNNYISCSLDSLMSEDLLHKEKINLFYRLLLSILNKFRSTNDCKRFRNFIDFDELYVRSKNIVNLNKEFIFSYKCYNWIANSCPVSSKYFYNEEELLSFYKEVIYHFNKCRLTNTDFIISGDGLYYNLSTNSNIKIIKRIFSEVYRSTFVKD